MVLGTGLMVHLANWKQEKQLVQYARKGNLSRQQADDHNLVLSGIMNKVQAIFLDYRLRSVALDVPTFKELYGSAGSSRSFHDFFNAELELLAHILAHNTIRQYWVTQKLLLEFMPNMDVNQLTPELVKKYDGFLRRHGYNPNSRMKHHRHTKRIMLLACKKYNQPSPYEGFKIKHIDGHREYLNKMEVQALIALLKTGKLNDQQQLALKKYLFSCHVGGLRISDIHSIGIDDVFDGVLVCVPQKTVGMNKRVQIPMAKEAMDFVQHRTGARFFDVQADVQINLCLKKAAKLTGLKKTLTFHTARHTFAIGYFNAGGKVEVLQQILAQRYKSNNVIRAY